MSNILKKVVLLLILISFSVIGIKAHTMTADFSVSPLLPANQFKANEGFFDLLMKPGEQQEVEVRVINYSAKSLSIEIAVANATTNSNGLVEYVPNKIKPDKSLLYPLKDYVSYPAEPTIPPRSSQLVTFKVIMPSENFKGVIAGGLTFKAKQKDETQLKLKQGEALTSQYQYNIALLLHQNKEIIPPELKLTNMQVSALDRDCVINVNLQNSAMTYLSGMNIEATIKGKTNPGLKYSLKNSGLQMAPNSNFNLPIPMIGQAGGDKTLQAGKYHLQLVAYGKNSPEGKYESKDAQGNQAKYEYKWTFDRDFTVTKEEVGVLNRQAANKYQDDLINWLVFSVILFVLLPILAVMLLIWRKQGK